MRKLVVLVVIFLATLGVYVAAGFRAGPVIQIAQPQKFVGVSTAIDIVIDAPGGALSSLRVAFEQNGIETVVFGVEDGVPVEALTLSPDTPDRVRLVQAIGRDNVPTLKSGPGRILISAARPVLFGLRQIATSASHDVQVRLERPTIAAVSTHHYINLGGSEMVVYRVSPADVLSGVRVGDVEYPGYPASGATADGVSLSDPALRVAFFALRHDQPLATPMHLFARDEAGNAARAAFDFRTFPKPFKQSRIEINDTLLERVVPAILAGTTDVRPTGALIDQFVAINSELRRKNAEKIASLAGQSSAEMLWLGVVFHPFTNSKAEAAFADQRTYLYKGREVDRQVHLGFDLASFAGTEVVASNRGKVVLAEQLGIYGQCVIVDHGLGVQSLYAHLSAIDVKPGATVAKGQRLGRSGMTGLAAGDHLHFTMLVHGQMVNPIEWWDAHWIQDRVLRKLREAH